MATRATGFTLVEVLIALGLFMAIAVGVAQLIAVATAAVHSAREQSSTVILAAAKIDQLRALDWGYEPDESGPVIARSDLTTNVSHPAYPSDGPGLAPSPSGTLTRSTPPYVDYLDASGSWVGNDPEPPPNAVFIRRWAVEPLAGDPGRTLVLRVLVTTVRLERARGGAVWERRTGTEALLVSVRTRKEQ